MSNIENDCFSQNDQQQYGHGVKHRHVVTLTSGTTSISDQSTAGTDIIFAGTTFTNEPVLQFLHPGAFSSSTADNVIYSVRSLTVAGDPWAGGTPAYGSVDLAFETTFNVTNGLHISDGELDFVQGVGSHLELDGNSTIDNGGTFTDAGRGRQAGASITVNGTLTLGASGKNVFSPSVAGVSGVIRELGKDDIVGVGGVGKDFRIDARAGTFGYFSGIANFSGTIGPAEGSHAPSLGPTATISLSLLNNSAASVETAKFDTSIGMLSLLDAKGGDVADFRFTGNARGLNVAVQGYGVLITDHPGQASSIPISFT